MICLLDQWLEEEQRHESSEKDVERYLSFVHEDELEEPSILAKEGIN